jgi:hypothetical protein
MTIVARYLISHPDALAELGELDAALYDGTQTSSSACDCRPGSLASTWTKRSTCAQPCCSVSPPRIGRTRSFDSRFRELTDAASPG